MVTIVDGEVTHGKRKKIINIVYMIEIKHLQGSDIEYKDEVFKLFDEATRYLTAFKWCKKILNCWLADGFGYILCIFYFDIMPTPESNADNKLWVIVGDIPPAYLDTIEYKTANDALSFYCFLMEEWVENVKKGKSVADCYPINVAPTIEHANMLETRIKLIKSDFLPYV